MRTTIDLPEELFREAKMLAVQQGRTLKELVTECLRYGLQRSSGVSQEVKSRRESPPLAILKSEGLASPAALSNRQINAILENEDLEALRKLKDRRGDES